MITGEQAYEHWRHIAPGTPPWSHLKSVYQIAWDALMRDMEQRCEYTAPNGLRCCLGIEHSHGHRVSIEDVIAWTKQGESK